MVRSILFFAAAAATVAGQVSCTVPQLDVPACPKVGTITYNKSVPNKTEFPLTQVDLCYSQSSIELTFTAYNETNFYFNSSRGTNDDIWAEEVMEAFIYKGTDDPQTYLEYEINPNNVTYQAFVYNPTKVRTPGAAFDHFFINDIYNDGFSATTTLDKNAETWVSKAKIPLGLFNVDSGKAKGTEWRMNFFRTVTSAAMNGSQDLGAWNPPNQASFHMSPYFGKVKFI